ncbi:universal stress protein [Microbacterium hydrocarbonoxydans]|uniref:universal stress protein n=1 Tax=Microbacterium hydrocarbonoxydans TaxID=273678 RepID=UPI0013DBFA61|nr:universal stress protein [Microbacterium hydrocarbonoxydans]
MFSRLVVAVGSEDGAAAAAWASAHASWAPAPPIGIHVVTDDSAPAPPSSPSSPSKIIRDPDIPQAIAAFVRADDLLVIGTGKTGFIRSRIFGSLGLRIVSAVPCGVAVIPQVDLRFRRGVVAGVGSLSGAGPIVSAAGAEAAARAETLTVLHSSYEGVVPAPVETAAAQLEQLIADLALSRPGIESRARRTTRPPAEALLDASRNAALLVLGTHRGRPPGPVIHDVLMNINAPVLIVNLAATADGRRAVVPTAR